MRDQAICSQNQATTSETRKKVLAVQLRLGDPALRVRGPYMRGTHSTRFAQQKDATEKGNIQQVAIGHVVAREDM